MIPEISVVVPVYNSQDTLKDLVHRIDLVMKKIKCSYEIILVNDYSLDESWDHIKKISTANLYPLKALNLSRNFGQHYAITAGLDAARGNWIVVMDCDLQDLPEEIEKLYHKAVSGFDVVLGCRIIRRDKFLKRLGSASFYSLLSFLTGIEHDRTVANFGIYSLKVIEVVKSMREKIRYFPVMVKWVGFKVTKIEINHAERTIGKTSYSLGKLFNLAVDIILAFSDKPLRLTAQLGFLISSISFLIASVYFTKAMNGQVVVVGWASVAISIWFLSGIIIFVLGVMGLYVGKIFEQVKNRPLYIINEKIEING